MRNEIQSGEPLSSLGGEHIRACLPEEVWAVLRDPCVPAIVLGTGKIAVNKTAQNMPAFMVQGD